jgi:predicted negative regulator of RcsB-dependent stress response
MDEYLTEKEQIELIRRWWRENGWFLIGGAAIVAIGYFGWYQYRAYQQRVAEDAAALYQELKQVVDDDDREQAEELLARLESDYSSSAYLDQARLLIASDNLIRDTQRSIDELTAVMEESRDDGMVTIARLRLARVLAYAEQYERALEVLDVSDPGEFAPRFSEIRGDIHAAMGDTEAAVDAYTDALLSSGNGTIDTEYVQLKLNDLVQAGIADSAEPAESEDDG